MASETYFNIGDRVKLSKDWLDSFPDRLARLRGRIVECDDSPRECCYYLVKWENISDQELLDEDIDPEDFLQSDALVPA